MKPKRRRASAYSGSDDDEILPSQHRKRAIDAMEGRLASLAGEVSALQSALEDLRKHYGELAAQGEILDAQLRGRGHAAHAETNISNRVAAMADVNATARGSDMVNLRASLFSTAEPASPGWHASGDRQQAYRKSPNGTDTRSTGTVGQAGPSSSLLVAQTHGQQPNKGVNGAADPVFQPAIVPDFWDEILMTSYQDEHHDQELLNTDCGMQLAAGSTTGSPVEALNAGAGTYNSGAQQLQQQQQQLLLGGQAPAPGVSTAAASGTGANGAPCDAQAGDAMPAGKGQTHEQQQARQQSGRPSLDPKSGQPPSPTWWVPQLPPPQPMQHRQQQQRMSAGGLAQAEQAAAAGDGGGGGQSSAGAKDATPQTVGALLHRSQLAPPLEETTCAPTPLALPLPHSQSLPLPLVIPHALQLSHPMDGMTMMPTSPTGAAAAAVTTAAGGVGVGPMGPRRRMRVGPPYHPHLHAHAHPLMAAPVAPGLHPLPSASAFAMSMRTSQQLSAVGVAHQDRLSGGGAAAPTAGPTAGGSADGGAPGAPDQPAPRHDDTRAAAGGGGEFQVPPAPDRRSGGGTGGAGSGGGSSRSSGGGAPASSHFFAALGGFSTQQDASYMPTTPQKATHMRQHQQQHQQQQDVAQQQRQPWVGTEPGSWRNSPGGSSSYSNCDMGSLAADGGATAGAHISLALTRSASAPAVAACQQTNDAVTSLYGAWAFAAPPQPLVKDEPAAGCSMAPQPSPSPVQALAPSPLEAALAAAGGGAPQAAAGDWAAFEMKNEVGSPREDVLLSSDGAKRSGGGNGAAPEMAQQGVDGSSGSGGAASGAFRRACSQGGMEPQQQPQQQGLCYPEGAPQGDGGRLNSGGGIAHGEPGIIRGTASAGALPPPYGMPWTAGYPPPYMPPYGGQFSPVPMPVRFGATPPRGVRWRRMPACGVPSPMPLPAGSPRQPPQPGPHGYARPMPVKYLSALPPMPQLLPPHMPHAASTTSPGQSALDSFGADGGMPRSVTAPGRPTTLPYGTQAPPGALPSPTGPGPAGPQFPPAVGG